MLVVLLAAINFQGHSILCLPENLTEVQSSKIPYLYMLGLIHIQSVSY